VSDLFGADFDVDRDAVREAIGRRGTFSLVHMELVLEVDCVVRKESEYGREEFRRRRRVAIDELQLFLVAPEDLLISTLDRARDTRSDVQLADARNLLACAQLDRDYLARWIARLGLASLYGEISGGDTPPAAEHRYREMLLRRSGAERVRMGASMLSTARALAVASIRAQDPKVSPAGLRRLLFLRFYGGDLGPEERERIAARLAGDVSARVGARRRVAVDWDDLEMALTGNPGSWTYYLDVRSGEVQMVPVDRLEVDGDWPSEADIDDGLDAGHLIAVEPLESSVEYGWMAEFTATVGDARLGDRLEAALAGRGAFRRFKSVLLDHPAERARWFAFRDERLRAAARDWLAEHAIEPTTAPPPIGELP
jgi:hypothetical protein